MPGVGVPAVTAAARLPVIGAVGCEVPALLFLGSSGACGVKHIPYTLGDWCPHIGSRRVYGGCLLTPAVPWVLEDSRCPCHPFVMQIGKYIPTTLADGGICGGCGFS